MSAPTAFGGLDGPGVRVPPPVLFATGVGIGELLDLALPISVPATTTTTVLACVTGGAGAALAASFVLALHRAGTTIDPNRPATALVTTGPYRLTRNPGYLAMTLGCLSIALATHSVGALVMLLPTVAVIDRAVIAREERYLASAFPDTYDAYRKRVRRWL